MLVEFIVHDLWSKYGIRLKQKNYGLQYRSYGSGSRASSQTSLRDMLHTWKIKQKNVILY